MMKFDNEQLADKSPCAGVRADLKMCLLQSDCCKIVSFPTNFVIISGCLLIP
jgi:cytochrome c oxidase assembly factor 5